MTKVRWARIGILAATAAFHLSCGGDQPAQPTPAPTPTPTPVPANARAFIYLLRDETLRSFEVDPPNGLPVPLGSLTIPQADRVAIDPRGRFVYVSGWDYEANTGFVRSYAVDAGDASLQLASELQLVGKPTRLTAGENYLVTFTDRFPTSHHSHVDWTVNAVDARGDLLAMSEEYPRTGRPERGSFGWVDCPMWWLPGVGATGDLAAYVVDGHMYGCQLRSVFTVRVTDKAIRPVGSDAMPADIYVGDAWVGAAASLGGNIVVSDDDTGRLTVLAPDPQTGSVSVRSHAIGTGSSPLMLLSAAPSGDRLAVSDDRWLSLYTLLASGELVRTDQLPVASSFWPQSFAFHPSGGFLYVSQFRGVTVFSIGPDGKLSEIGTTPAASGQLVVGPAPG